MTTNGSAVQRGPVRLTVLVGNPRAASRTRLAAEAVASALADALRDGGLDSSMATVELADVAGELFAMESAAVGALLDTVRSSDLLVVASPTYKASYTGLLKAFFDRMTNDTLKGSVAIPVMLGGAPTHTLAVELHLRPLLLEVGATCPTHGLFILESDLGRLDDVVGAWLTPDRDVLLALLARARPA